MFEFAGKWIDGKFIAFRDWLDRKLVPAWRIWWKMLSMRLGMLVAALATFLTAAPDTLKQSLDSLPDWLRQSLPAWIGPATLTLLFFARFWDQTKAKPAPSQDIEHGAE